MNHRNALAMVALLACTASIAGAQDQESIYQGRLASPVEAPVQTVMRTYEDAHVTAIYQRLPRWVHKKLALVDFSRSIVLVVAGPRRVGIVEEWIKNSGDTAHERLASRDKVLHVPHEAGEQGGPVDHVHLVRMTRHSVLGEDGYRAFRVAFEPVRVQASGRITGLLRRGAGPGHPFAVLDEPRGREWDLKNVSPVVLTEVGIVDHTGKLARVHGRVLEHGGRHRIHAERIELIDEQDRVLRTIEPQVFEGVMRYQRLDRGEGRPLLEIVMDPHEGLGHFEGQRVQVKGWSLGDATRHAGEELMVADGIRLAPTAAPAAGLTGTITNRIR